jgi:predicted amidohydrolase YtcJ
MYSSANTWSSELQYVPRALTAKLIKHYSGGSQHDFEQDLSFSLAVVSGLHSRGAGLLLGSDVFKMNVMPGFSALHELEYLVGAGLTPYEALQTGTVNAALALHEIETLGTIDVGKRADLLLLTANPLGSVRNVSRRVGVMLRGRWLPESEMQNRLATVARAIATADR